MRTLTIALSLITVIAETPSVPQKPIPLKAFEGGAVMVVCRSETGMKPNFFCKDGGGPCDSVETPPKSGSRLVLCDTIKGHSNVLLTHLTENDSGVYQCGVGKHPHGLKNITFRLDVKKDLLYGKSIQINGHPGENSTVSCHYPDQMKKNLKYLYRRSDLSICSELITSESATDESKPSRYVMVDDKEGRFFNVTIRNMTLDDTGEYWCGVGTGTNTGSRNLLTVVKLHVIDPTRQEIPATTASSTSSLKVQTPAQATTQPGAITSDSTALSHPITITSLTLVALVAGLAGFIVFVCWRRKTQRPASTAEGKCRDLTADCVYEEIKDATNPNPAGSSTPESVYALAQLPSDLSEGPGYASVRFHKHSSGPHDSSTTVSVRGAVSTEYSTIQHHT